MCTMQQYNYLPGCAGPFMSHHWIVICQVVMASIYVYISVNNVNVQMVSHRFSICDPSVLPALK